MVMLPGIDVRVVTTRATKTPPGLALPAVIIDSAKGPLAQFELITSVHDFKQLYGERATYSDSRHFDAVLTLLSNSPGVYVCRLRKYDTALHSAFSVNQNEVALGGGGGSGPVTTDAYRTTDMASDWVITQGTFSGGVFNSVLQGADTLLHVSLNPASKFALPDVDILGVKVTHTVPFPISMTLLDSTQSFVTPGYESGVEVKTSLNGLVSDDLQSIECVVLGDFAFQVTAIQLLIKGEDLPVVDA